jgi:hypothetical protein
LIRFEIVYTLQVSEQRRALESDASKARVWKAVRKTLALMETNIRHPGLRTHKFDGQKGPQGQDVFEAYAQKRTPGAYRIFWCYAVEPRTIIILLIVPHP